MDPLPPTDPTTWAPSPEPPGRGCITPIMVVLFITVFALATVSALAATLTAAPGPGGEDYRPALVGISALLGLITVGGGITLTRAQRRGEASRRQQVTAVAHPTSDARLGIFASDPTRPYKRLRLNSRQFWPATLRVAGGWAEVHINDTGAVVLTAPGHEVHLEVSRTLGVVGRLRLTHPGGALEIWPLPLHVAGGAGLAQDGLAEEQIRHVELTLNGYQVPGGERANGQ